MFWDRLDQGTLSPMRLGLEQEGVIASEWGVSLGIIAGRASMD
jgi:hypothetical protein